MLQNVEFSERPERFEVEEKGGGVVVTLNDNIRQAKKGDGEQAWFADVYYLRMAKAENIADRVERNYDVFLDKAKADDAAEEARKAAEAAKLTMDDLTEIAVDQEYRIALLELGV